MEETGIVTEVSGGFATVKIKRGAACGKCGACIGAGADMFITVENAPRAEAGDTVSLELKTDRFLTASAILYGLPCAAFIAGAFLGERLSGSEAAGFAAGVLAVAAVWAAIKLNDNKISGSGKYTPVITRVRKEKSRR
ncbi:MAG: SoxR reducing system RseC family protein [Clostridiales bacterium]|jgi:positive regulator of sigma E activity|nr:SoxR reducing system RseC family protein [Clostridiales bacterium]